MADKVEITAIDYDGLLKLFCSTERHRPAMQQPNTIGDKTYATDGVVLAIVPNEYLRNYYTPHEKVPIYQNVLDQIKECKPIEFKDTDLFKAMEVHPKEYDVSECKECDGDGECPHCHRNCEYCDGEGMVENTSLPMIYAKKATIQINEQRFSVHRLQWLEKTIAMLMVDSFELTGYSSAASLFRIGPVQVLMARMNHEEENYPNIILKSII